MSKNILIIEPSTSGLEILPTIFKMGLKTFVFTADKDERIIPKKYNVYIYQKIVIETNDINKLENETRMLHKKYTFAAVIPGFEIFVATAARLANLIKAPGISIKTAEALRNKFMMRSMLTNKGFKTPHYYLLESSKDIEAHINELNFPCVLKPIDQSGSVHVSKIHNIVELKNAYHFLSTDNWTEMGKGIGKVAILEEYIEGPEYSVEGFVNNKKINIVSVTEKLIQGNPYFIEMGHIVPANIDLEGKKKINSYIMEIIEALEFNLGVFHAEIKLSSKGPILIEIAGRLAGDKICDLIQYAYNVNLYQIMVSCHLNDFVEEKNINIKKYAGIRFFAAPHLEKYTKIDGVDDLIALDGYCEFKVLIPPKKSIPLFQNFSARIAYCIFTAPSYNELTNALNKANELISFS